jgi:IS30 family transposase
VNGASHKGAIVTMVERKNRQVIIAKVTNKKSKLVYSVIIDKLKPMAASIKTPRFDNSK